MDCTPPGSSVHGDSLGKNTGVGCHALLQGIFPTHGLNPDLLHCRHILYHLSTREAQLIPLSSVVQLSLTVCNPMDCSMPGFPIHHQLPELTQTHVHWVSDAIQPSHFLSSPSAPAFSLLLHQSFQISQFIPSGGKSIGVSASASVLPMNIQDWFPLGWTVWISLQSKGQQQERSE